MSTKILMVCLGNICRSPLAEGILQSKLPKDQFIIDSAGTGGWHAGQLPDKRSIETAKKHGIDITNQRARQFKLTDFEDFDYIYTMDISNYKNILSLAPSEMAKSKVKLILNELFPNKNIEVPDPYYGGQDGFEEVFKMLDEACNVIVKKL
ncbi:low molecular weight phosphotyrosine protein phosphatase [Flavobacterium sediminilitoris]|uniref:protein-tyrosine-phosphatase n=1 Tax=Flavobacterium sediminilitoris TaxID=2024526 RepID=A0ABY4HM26_9FLAO|nr:MULTISPECIES: low molecular weight protein-tyrosine-phosphatase [Flavobacterium]UOX33914.1 low molecular weight phosphotyrosine protein phosphatase [Flavobacterium sediminilitoris]